jgi:RES domain-containing protein
MGMTEDLDSEEPSLPAVQAEAAARYHEPPATIPRDAMWDAIQARRLVAGASDVMASEAVSNPSAVGVTVTRTTRGALARLPRWLAVAATAAVVVIGITVSTRTAVQPATPSDVAGDSASSAVAWQEASTEHFGLAESMLTLLSASPQAEHDRQLSAWSRDLLESTRLMMDSPAGRDPKRRMLLQELELVLVQLVESGPAMRADDRNTMDELLSRSARLLTRIRTTVPVGIPASHN